jgi:hypothetical protein
MTIEEEQVGHYRRCEVAAMRVEIRYLKITAGKF